MSSWCPVPAAGSDDRNWRRERRERQARSRERVSPWRGAGACHHHAPQPGRACPRLVHAPAPQTPCASPPASSCHPRSARHLATAHPERQDGSMPLSTQRLGVCRQRSASYTPLCCARGMRPSTPPCLRLRLNRRNKRPARRVRVGHGVRPTTVRTPSRHGRSACSRKPAGQLCASTRQRRRGRGCWCRRCVGF